MRLPPALLVVTATLVAASCATTGDKASLYPPRPEVVPGPPIADPPLQRATMHIALTQKGLEQLLSALVPAEGTGGYELLTRDYDYSWKREPFALKFDDARKAILAHTDVTAHVEVPGGSLDLPLTV